MLFATGQGGSCISLMFRAPLYRPYCGPYWICQAGIDGCFWKGWVGMRV